MIPREPTPKEPRTLATIAIGIAGFALVLGPLASILEEPLGLEWPVAITTAGLSMIAAHVSMKTKWPEQVAIRAFGWFVMAAMLNSGAGYLAAIFVYGRPEGVVYLLHALALGVPVAVPLGSLFAALYLVPLLYTENERACPSYFGYDRAGVVTFGWLFVISVASARFATGTAAGTLAVVALASLGVALFFAGRLRARRRWMAYVAAGRDPDWCLCDPEDLNLPVGLPRLDRLATHDPPQVLCARTPTSGGPYRQAPDREPWAFAG